MYYEPKHLCFPGSVVPDRRIKCEKCKRSMKLSQTEVASLVSQIGDEYIALLLVPSGGSNRIVMSNCQMLWIAPHDQAASRGAASVD